MTSLNKDKLIKYLIISIPVTLVFSIFFAELILFIISLFFIRDYFKEKKNKKNWFYILVAIFVFYVAMNSVSFNQGLNFKSTFFYFRFLLYFFGIIFYLKKLGIHNDLTISFVLTSSILIIDGIIQFIFGSNIMSV